MKRRRREDEEHQCKETSQPHFKPPFVHNPTAKWPSQPDYFNNGANPSTIAR